MSKAVLIIDMPEGCDDCILHDYHFCSVTGGCVEANIFDIKNEDKPCWCPFRALSEEQYGRICAILDNEM